MIVKVIDTVLMAIGLFMIAECVFKYPPRSSVNAVRTLSENKIPLKEKIYGPVAKLVLPLVHISESKREVMEKDLKYAGLSETPEYYIANATAKSIVYIILGLFLLPIFPIGTAAITVIAVTAFFKNIKIKAGEIRKQKIEAETPRFTSYIVQNLPRRQGIETMIRGYREIAEKELGEELDILITGLRTKNHETALIEFESRINSTAMSDLVKGLLGIENGEDMTAYLINLQVRMNKSEEALLKKEAEKRPEKLGPASWLLFLSIGLIYITVLGMQLFDNLSYFK